MNWNNYLLEKKAPSSYAHLGVIEGTVSGVFDLSQLPKNTKILSLSTPLKKFNLHYTNYDALTGNSVIEGICLNDIDDERLAVFATLPNLKYLDLSGNKQETIPDLSSLQSLEVLILANLTRVPSIDFVSGLRGLKTLYIYGINKMTDLSPLSSLTSLRELSLHHGKMSGTGTPVKSMKPLSTLAELRYLDFVLNIKGNNYDVSPLFSLKKLQSLFLLPRYLKNGQREQLLSNLPLLKNL